MIETSVLLVRQVPVTTVPATVTAYYLCTLTTTTTACSTHPLLIPHPPHHHSHLSLPPPPAAALSPTHPTDTTLVLSHTGQEVSLLALCRHARESGRAIELVPCPSPGSLTPVSQPPLRMTAEAGGGVAVKGAGRGEQGRKGVAQLVVSGEGVGMLHCVCVVRHSHTHTATHTGPSAPPSLAITHSLSLTPSPLPPGPRASPLPLLQPHPPPGPGLIPGPPGSVHRHRPAHHHPVSDRRRGA